MTDSDNNPEIDEGVIENVLYLIEQLEDVNLPCSVRGMCTIIATSLKDSGIDISDFSDANLPELAGCSPATEFFRSSSANVLTSPLELVSDSSIVLPTKIYAGSKLSNESVASIYAIYVKLAYLFNMTPYQDYHIGWIAELKNIVVSLRSSGFDTSILADQIDISVLLLSNVKPDVASMLPRVDATYIEPSLIERVLTMLEKLDVSVLPAWSPHMNRYSDIAKESVNGDKDGPIWDTDNKSAGSIFSYVVEAVNSTIYDRHYQDKKGLAAFIKGIGSGAHLYFVGTPLYSLISYTISALSNSVTHDIETHMIDVEDVRQPKMPLKIVISSSMSHMNEPSLEKMVVDYNKSVDDAVSPPQEPINSNGSMLQPPQVNINTDNTKYEPGVNNIIRRQIRDTNDNYGMGNNQGYPQQMPQQMFPQQSQFPQQGQFPSNNAFPQQGQFPQAGGYPQNGFQQPMNNPQNTQYVPGRNGYGGINR